MSIERDQPGQAEEAYAYTPGLKVKRLLTVRKERRLPIPGEVLVGVGERVDFDTVVARTFIPGNPSLVPVSDILNIFENDAPHYMVKDVGDEVSKDEVIAVKSTFFGLSKKVVTSPCDGVIKEISEFTGAALIREPDIQVEVKAYIPGKVVEVLPKIGVLIETEAAYLQGIFGIGGENHGELVLVAITPEDSLTADMVSSECKGKILVAGAMVTGDAIRKAIEVGVIGIVSGGIESAELTDLLGYDIGVAITGQEELGITLIVTEGFGKMGMPEKVFHLLKDFDNHQVAINGATQIRAGVLRPEIIIPSIGSMEETGEPELESGMKIGTPIRIIRAPYFGRIGTVAGLPISLQEIETESNVRVIEVMLENGERVIVPRANVEIIEE
jgi:hypothetical protein